jgi:ATP-dependent NAD(P)H-hydrate dehydratase
VYHYTKRGRTGQIKKSIGKQYHNQGISDCLERLETCKQISSILKVTVLSKGNSDIIVTGDDITINNSNGIPRRCGGQGDLLAGCLATFYNWGLKSNAESEIKHSIPQLCAYGASILVRDASFNAFQIHKRSMVASDIIQHIPISFQKLFEHDTK